MPVDVDFPNRTIKVVFNGLIIAAINEKNPFAEVGALVDSPCHKANLRVVRRFPNGSEEIVHQSDPKNRVSLEVSGTSKPGIQTYRKPGFDRKKDNVHNDNDENDFGYFVDIVKDLHPNRQYEPKPGSIKPIFRINEGIFYTDAFAAERMNEIRGGETKLFGSIAEAIAANIYIDQPDSKAILIVDGQEVLSVDICDSKKNISYTIEFDCECNAPAVISDFNTVYKGLIPDTPQGDQVIFEDEKAAVKIAAGSSPLTICGGTGHSGLSHL